MRFESAETVEERVLVLAPWGRDAALAREILRSAGVAAETVPTLGDLCARLAEGAGALVLTQEALRPRDLPRLADALSQQPPWSDLPVLVFSGRARGEGAPGDGRAALDGIANLILLDRPTRRVALLSAVHAALRARRRQYEVRDLLLQLRQAVRDRDQFLAMLGHELRNPLGAILASVQLMEQKEPEKSPRERRVIRRQTQLLSRLVDDLLDVARVTSGKIVLDRRSVDLRELVARCVLNSGGAAKDAGISLSLSTNGAAWVSGDAVRLEQIVNNLLTNALKYTPPGGRVEVRIARDGPDAVVRVADTGVGMDPEILPRVFELFTQADDALDRAHGGLGIGLTLVRSLVELHGGTVSAESPGRGLGSTFTVRLPGAEVGATASAEEEGGGPALESRRILLVEDNADVRDSLRELLEESGHLVMAAADGLEGIQLASSFRPDAAFVDIGLPGLDGYGVARHLRQILGDDVLLVALTGYGLPEDRRRALEGGFDAHLTKPVTLRAILRLLAEARVPH
ncbi:MAG TPA: ATP-binding protein [Thermoanaerobaculia bacterium]|jgi:signal transduction histidine kinase|nr:ATP-binding protein [Thermoanaerobaculia bacterium]